MNIQVGWVVIATALIMLLTVSIGYFRGFLKSALTFGHLFIAIALMIVISPYVKTGLEKIGVNDMIRTRIEQRVDAAVEERANAALGALGISVSDAEREQLVDSYESQMSRSEQNEVIEQSFSEGIIRRLLINNNNDRTYVEMGADVVSEYVSAYLADIILTIISGLAVFILAQILLHVLMALTDVIEKVPVIGGINRLMGGVLGIIIGLIIIWILYFAINLFEGTGFGSSALTQIQGNIVLTMIYNLNPLLLLLG